MSYSFEKILESSVEGYAIIGLNGKINWCNKALSCLFGCKKEWLVGKNVIEICYANAKNVADHILQEIIDGAIGNIRFERQFIRMDNKIMWCKVCASIVKNEKDIPSFLFVHIEDVTKCKLNQSFLKETVSDIVNFLKEK